MKYRNEAGEQFYVATTGVSEKGTHYAVACIDLDGEETTMFTSPIHEPSVNKMEIEQKLAEYAKENGLIPELIWKLQTGERILQGNPKTENDFIAVDDKAKAEAFDEYLAAKSRIAELEAEKKQEIEEVKKDFAEKIEAEEEVMDSIESIVRTGTRKEECEASWERDLESGAMLLIRHDNLKVLNWRKMTDQEAQVSIEDQEAQEG